MKIRLLFIWVIFLSRITMAQELIPGNFDLIDHHGNQVTEASYNGKLRLVFFGFTSCPIICPTTMTDIVQTMSQLDTLNEEVQPLLITIDPEIDDVAHLAEYVTIFHPNIVGLTGTKTQISAAAKAFNATFGRSKKADGGSGTIFHSAFIYLMDKEGKFIEIFGYGTSPSKITKTIKEYLQA